MLCRLGNDDLPASASWPASSRPSTTGGAATTKVVDGRDKSGHDTGTLAAGYDTRIVTADHPAHEPGHQPSAPTPPPPARARPDRRSAAAGARTPGRSPA